MELSGKTALVTGGAKRLGRATALALAEQGVGVVVHFRASKEEADGVAAEVAEQGGRAWTLQADLGDPQEAEKLLDRAVAEAGPLDILVNNAAVFPESHLTDFTPDDLHASINVNALAPLLIARGFAAQNRAGHIVNFLDCRIADRDEHHAAYHLSKRMLFEMTRLMAVEFAPNVQVNAVAPGLILPPEGKDESYLAALAHTNPLQRFGGPEDITDTVLFLLKSGFITGQVVFVDGGRHILGCMYD